MTVSGRRLFPFVTTILFLAIIVVTALPARNASALTLTSKSLTLQSTASYGGSQPSGVVNHLFSFSLASGTSVGSIQFVYCIAPDGTCVTPTGLSTSGATLGTQSGLTFTSINVATAGAPYIYSASALSASANEAVSFQLKTITNPNGSDCSGTLNNCTFYVKITTYSTTSPNGADIIDTGEVAASVNPQITLTGTMPESLIFCVGGTVGTTNNVPNCALTTSGSITFNQDFSPNATATATSQMGASTNALTGYTITVDGPTLTSGGNSITAIGSTATASGFGVSQFGLNLMANTTPSVGTAVNPTNDGTNYFGYPLAPFKTVNSYAFTADVGATINLNTIANSANNTGGAAQPTDGQVYTVSYIVNVPGKQVAGTYTTTLTYICTATF
jgi:hypothetical protein